VARIAIGVELPTNTTIKRRRLCKASLVFAENELLNVLAPYLQEDNSVDKLLS
jgi:hypothetical protein